LSRVIQFYLKFGCSQPSNISSTEPVLLRYSTDGGIHWTLLGRYDVQPFLTTKYVVLKIPYEAKTNATRIHWWQPMADESHRTDWAIDQVNRVFVLFECILDCCVTLLHAVLQNIWKSLKQYFYGPLIQHFQSSEGYVKPSPHWRVAEVRTCRFQRL